MSKLRVHLPYVGHYPHRLAVGDILDPWSIREPRVRTLGKNVERGSGVIVGIADTGLTERWRLNVGRQVIHVSTEIGGTWEDGNGHGTHVAGTLAGWQSDEQGPGVAPGVTVHTGRCLDSGGGGTDDGMGRVVRALVDSGCDLINISAGSEAHLPATEAAVQYAFNSGCLCFVASGNFGPSGKNPLAELDCVFSVASLDRQLKPSSFSSPSSVDGCAPGEQIESFWLGGRVNVLGGTSMASPWHCGVAAIMQGQRLSIGLAKFTPQELIQALWDVAEDRGPVGDDPLCGKGMMSVDEYERYWREKSSTEPDKWELLFGGEMETDTHKNVGMWGQPK